MNKMVFGALGVLMIATCGCINDTVVPPPPRPTAITVKSTATDKNSSRLAAWLQSDIERCMAERGFAVGSAFPTDGVVSVTVTRRETARLDDWRTYEGTAELRVDTAGPNGKLISTATFSFAGERSLDEIKAERSVANGLAKKINGWLNRKVTTDTVPQVPTPPPAK